MQRLFKFVLFVAFVAVAGIGSDQITCVPVEPEEPICLVPEDCDGLPHVACVGQWECLAGACAWTCDVEPPECVGEGETGSGMIPGSPTCCDGLDAISVAQYNPETGMCAMATDIFLCAQCGNGTCEADWENFCNCPEDCPQQVEPVALCEATGGSWTGCGSGCGPWACGEPFPEICPAVCIPQCQCPDDAPGWSPTEGCVACSCGEWTVTYQALVAQLKSCTDASQCVALPGTSCGCTNNLVVNGSNNLDFFWHLADLMGQAGCSPFMSTCDCPAADGFICQDNLCQWNYL